MSDTNRVSLAYVKETTYGTTPSGPPTLKSLRFTGESLSQENTTVTSQEIRSDRQIVDLLRTGVRAPGDLNFEFSYGAFDEWMEWALLSATGTTPATNTPTSGSITTGGVLTSTGGTAIATGLAAGDWIEVRGFVNAGNNGYFKIATFTSASNVTLVGTTSAFVNETTVAGVTGTTGSTILAGTTLSSMSVEKNYADATAGSRFEVTVGVCLDGFSFNIPVDNIVTGVFRLLGKSCSSPTATVGTGTNTAAAQNPVQTGVDNVLSVLEGTSYTPQATVSAALDLKNNLRARLQLGTLGPVSIGTGTINLTGKHTSYYTDKAIIDKANAQTVSALAYILQESAGANAIVFDMPRIKYSAGRRVAGGINQDVMADMDFTAYRHPTEGVTFRIVRFV